VKILRTIIWVLAAVGFLIFAVYNWRPVELTLWQNVVLETKVPVLALLAFAVGLVPMWAYHRSVAWGLNRRVRALETSLKNAAMARPAEIAPVIAADSSVDKPAKSAGEPADPLAPSDGGAGE
jgi:lipopolysaccharide assembly protein A